MFDCVSLEAHIIVCKPPRADFVCVYNGMESLNVQPAGAEATYIQTTDQEVLVNVCKPPRADSVLGG